MRLSMLSIIFWISHCLLNVTSRMAWATKGTDCFNPTTIYAAIPLFKTPCQLLYILLINTAQIFANPFYLSSKHSREKRSLFHNAFLTLLTHQHHLVEFYLAMAKMTLVIFQVITCTLGVTYNLNVRHTESLVLNMVVFLAGYKSFFGGVYSGVHCSCWWWYFVYLLRGFLNHLLF